MKTSERDKVFQKNLKRIEESKIIKSIFAVMIKLNRVGEERYLVL